MQNEQNASNIRQFHSDRYPRAIKYIGDIAFPQIQFEYILGAAFLEHSELFIQIADPDFLMDIMEEVAPVHYAFDRGIEYVYGL
jgi:hypothetical protein